MDLEASSLMRGEDIIEINANLVHHKIFPSRFMFSLDCQFFMVKPFGRFVLKMTHDNW